MRRPRRRHPACIRLVTLPLAGRAGGGSRHVAGIGLIDTYVEGQPARISAIVPPGTAEEAVSHRGDAQCLDLPRRRA
jgi:hypothetical protein